MRLTRMLCATLLIAMLISGALSVVGCELRGANGSAATDVLATDPPIVVQPAPISPATWNRRGQIIRQSNFDKLDSRLLENSEQAARTVYASVSAVDGSAVDVSGAFFLPHGQPPAGGWPVVSLAHGTTGIGKNCGLSSRPDLRGYADLVTSLLSSGFAVAATDYQGLGAEGVHPYLEPRTAAFNVIDAMRAIMRIYPSVSSRWISFGISQGGQASWAADELNGFYGGGLNLLGAVALSPAADIVGLADLAYTDSLSTDQLSAFPLVIMGLARYDTNIVLSHYLRGSATATSFVTCTGVGDKPLQTPLAQDARPTNPTDTEILTTALRRIALPQRPLSAPLLVINGSRDQLIPAAWVLTAIARSCQLGGQIEHREIEGVGHSDLSSGDTVESWISDRFADKPVSSTCGSVNR